MNKTCLITGANRGIGLSLAKLYKQKGWTVIATARDVEKALSLKNVADEVHCLDVSSETSITMLGESLKNKAIDLLINNAGLYNRVSFEELTAESLVQEYKVNAIGPFLVSRALLPSLKKSRSPRIVNMTSRMGSIADNGSGGSYGYRASKAALNALTKSWSIDFPEVPVVLVHPGFVQTEMTSGRGDMGPDECASKLSLIIDEFSTQDLNGCKFKSGCFYHRDGFVLPW